MDISPLADKQQQNKRRNSFGQSKRDPSYNLDEYSPESSLTANRTTESLSPQRIATLIEHLNQMSGTLDISFQTKFGSGATSNTIVEIVDTSEEEVLYELKMSDLYEIEKQINEDRVNDLSALICGSLFSLTA